MKVFMELLDNVDNEELKNNASEQNSKKDNLLNEAFVKKEEPKKIEVVNGEGDLTISPVSDYLEVEKPKPKENKSIIIPEVKDNVTGSKESKKEDEKIQKNSEN